MGQQCFKWLLTSLSSMKMSKECQVGKRLKIIQESNYKKSISLSRLLSQRLMRSTLKKTPPVLLQKISHAT